MTRVTTGEILEPLGWPCGWRPSLAGRPRPVAGRFYPLGVGRAASAVSAMFRSVFVTGRDIDRLEAAVEEMGPAATGVRADASVLADLGGLYARVREEAGRIDVLVANAGIVADAALGAHTEENVDLTPAVNVWGGWPTPRKSPRPASSWRRTPRRSSAAPNSSPTAATPGPERRPVRA